MESGHSEEYYYHIRSLKLHELNNIERASRFIYFNGLYIENSKGEFDVPFGKYKNPKIENLRMVSHYLNSADITITCLDYKEVCRMANRGDFLTTHLVEAPLSLNIQGMTLLKLTT